MMVVAFYAAVDASFADGCSGVFHPSTIAFEEWPVDVPRAVDEADGEPDH